MQKGGRESLARANCIHNLNWIAGRFAVLPLHQNRAAKRTTGYAHARPFVEVRMFSAELLQRPMLSAEHAGNRFDLFMIKLHDGCPRHELLDERWGLSVGPQVHIVKTPRSRC